MDASQEVAEQTQTTASSVRGVQVSWGVMGAVTPPTPPLPGRGAQLTRLSLRALP